LKPNEAKRFDQKDEIKNPVRNPANGRTFSGID
jgi:hypothetical protein